MSAADDFINSHQIVHVMGDHPHYDDSPEDAYYWACEVLGPEIGGQVFESTYYVSQVAFLTTVDNWGEVLNRSTWKAVDPTEYILNGYTKPVPSVLAREDGNWFFYKGMVNMIYSPSGSGKSWIALQACVETIQRGENVVYVDYEDSIGSIVSRLMQLGLTGQQILDQFMYVRPEGLPQGPELALFNVHTEKAGLVVVDSLGESMATMGLDQNLDDKVVQWFNLFVRYWASKGAAVLLVDHEAKNNLNKGFSIGSQRKKSAIDGMSLRIERKQALAKGVPGKYEIYCAKDRHGNYSADSKVGWLVLTPSEDDKQIEFKMYTPQDNPEVEQANIKKMADRVVDILEYMQTQTEPQTKTDIKKGVGGNGQNVARTVDNMVIAGTLIQTNGRYSLPEHRKDH